MSVRSVPDPLLHSLWKKKNPSVLLWVETGEWVGRQWGLLFLVPLLGGHGRVAWLSWTWAISLHADSDRKNELLYQSHKWILFTHTVCEHSKHFYFKIGEGVLLHWKKGEKIKAQLQMEAHCSFNNTLWAPTPFLPQGPSDSLFPAPSSGGLWNSSLSEHLQLCQGCSEASQGTYQDPGVRKALFPLTKQSKLKREFYLAIKKNAFESVLMRWMKPELIIQSEVSQKEKHQYSILTHIYGI